MHYGISPTINTPWLDPGEGFPHINTQLYGILDEGNRGILQPEQTFNLPENRDQQPTMHPVYGINPALSCAQQTGGGRCS